MQYEDAFLGFEIFLTFDKMMMKKFKKERVTKQVYSHALDSSVKLYLLAQQGFELNDNVSMLIGSQ